MGPGFGFEFLCAGFAAVLALVVASGLLRFAVVLANRMIGPAGTGAPIGWDWDADEDDEPAEPADGSGPIPVPSLGLGMLVMFLTVLVNGVIGFGLRFVLTLEPGRDMSDDEPVIWASQLVGLAAGFVVLMGLLAASLPTTPKRGALAAFVFYLLLFAIAVGLGLLVYILHG